MPFFSGRCTSTVKLDGRTAIVTGANTGIGKETALDFYKRGARVIMACRSAERGTEAKTNIENKCQSIPGTGALVLEQCDLGSLRSVRLFAQRVIDTEQHVHILVNNAGVMMCPKGETEDGFETQFGTNHLAHFLLTALLLPRIRNSTPARIVTVSSMLHDGGRLHLEDVNYKTRRYNAQDAYSQSKLANVLFSKELATKLEAYKIEGISTYSLHPGAINTELARHLDDTVFKGASSLYGFVAGPFIKTPLQGAQTTIYCAVDEKCANETGLYYSDCIVKKPSKRARDTECAKKLWELSAELVGLGDYDPFTAADTGVTAK